MEVACTDEVKIYKDEGEEEEQKSSENLTEDKVGLVIEGEGQCVQKGVFDWSLFSLHATGLAAAAAAAVASSAACPSAAWRQLPNPLHYYNHLSNHQSNHSSLGVGAVASTGTDRDHRHAKEQHASPSIPPSTWSELMRMQQPLFYDAAALQAAAVAAVAAAASTSPVCSSTSNWSINSSSCKPRQSPVNNNKGSTNSPAAVAAAALAAAAAAAVVASSTSTADLSPCPQRASTHSPSSYGFDKPINNLSTPKPSSDSRAPISSLLASFNESVTSPFSPPPPNHRQIRPVSTYSSDIQLGPPSTTLSSHHRQQHATNLSTAHWSSSNSSTTPWSPLSSSNGLTLSSSSTMLDDTTTDQSARLSPGSQQRVAAVAAARVRLLSSLAVAAAASNHPTPTSPSSSIADDSRGMTRSSHNPLGIDQLIAPASVGGHSTINDDARYIWQNHDNSCSHRSSQSMGNNNNHNLQLPRSNYGHLETTSLPANRPVTNSSRPPKHNKTLSTIAHRKSDNATRLAESTTTGKTNNICFDTPNSVHHHHQAKRVHIKKPLNAFMLFMKDMRPQVQEECTLKESAAINQILGKKWHELPRDKQAKYYEMARKEKEIHHQMFPGWSARDNYAMHSRRKKKRKLVSNPHHLPSPIGQHRGVAKMRPSPSSTLATGDFSEQHSRLHSRHYDQDSSACDGVVDQQPPSSELAGSANGSGSGLLDFASAKKCRARFGLEHQNRWCKPCRRKKKCIRFMADNEELDDTCPNSPFSNLPSDDDCQSGTTPTDNSPSTNLPLHYHSCSPPPPNLLAPNELWSPSVSCYLGNDARNNNDYLTSSLLMPSNYHPPDCLNKTEDGGGRFLDLSITSTTNGCNKRSPNLVTSPVTNNLHLVTNSPLNGNSVKVESLKESRANVS